MAVVFSFVVVESIETGPIRQERPVLLCWSASKMVPEDSLTSDVHLPA